MQSAFQNMYNFNEQTQQKVPNCAFKHTFIFNFLYSYSVWHVFSTPMYVFSFVLPLGCFCEPKALGHPVGRKEGSINLIFLFTYTSSN